MAEFPALPLWTDAYLADTRHLSTLEHGAYLLLLMEAWRRPSCALPDNDVLLARLAGLSPSEWEAVKPIVLEFWKIDGRSKEWVQSRLKKERCFVARRSALQRDRIAKRWNKKKNDDTAVLPDGYRSDTPTPTYRSKRKREGKPSPKKGSRLSEDWTLPKLWGEWAVQQQLSEKEVRDQAARFRDYWIGVPGQKGVKLDWQATWRNWIRSAIARGTGYVNGGARSRQPTASDSIMAELRAQDDAAEAKAAGVGR